MYGEIQSSWDREGDRFSLDVRIPPNTDARIYVPTTDPSSVTESGSAPGSAEGVNRLRSDGDYVVYEVGSGRYQFESTLSR
jgi:alpha-L-rhamnosidase